MISSRARTMAARRMALFQDRLRHQQEDSVVGDLEIDLPAAVGLRLIEIEQFDRPGSGFLTPEQAESAAERLVGLEWRAVRAEVGWGRWRARRLFRLADVLARWVRRPWRVGALFSGLGAALKQVPMPELPAPPSVDSYLKELRPVTSAVKPRPLPYPHIRVAHAGGLAMFGMVATHFDLATVNVEREMKTGFDMLLIEPGVDDPLASLTSETLDWFKTEGIPVLFVARTRPHLDHTFLSYVDLVLVEEPDLAEQAQSQGLDVLHIDPSVDDTVYNPIGWKQNPDHMLMVVADHPGIEADLDTLTPVAGQVSLYGPAIPGLGPARHTPERPTGSLLAEQAKNHLAVYATPQLSATTSSHHQLVLNLIAAGLPTITPPDPTLTRLIPNHLTATNNTELNTHLETLQHPPTRERHSVPNRRHILTNHTRTHRFEQILTHLDIPTNPQPRISILLATKRPDHIDHALENVTRQTWKNKELILILHGQNNFDLPHIQNLTHQLPYPTQIVPCDETEIFGDILNKGLHQATGTFISKMDDDDHYGPNHLTDLHTAHTYSNADIVGKWGNIVYMAGRDLTLDYLVENEEIRASHLPGATMLISAALMNKYRFERVDRHVDSTLWLRMRLDGFSMYSTHRFNFIRVRHSDHTFTRGDEAFFARSPGRLRLGLDLDGSMI